MPPDARRRGLVRTVTILAAAAFFAAILAACGGQAFDPSGACSVDGRAPGAYPELEALVPTRFRDQAPTSLDSGRSCTPSAIGSLASRGVTELRFAGATWDLGSGSAVSLAVLAADGLRQDWVEEFYETGARAAKNTENVTTGSETLPDGSSAFRLDTLNGESYQTVVVWPQGDAGRVRVAIIASFVRQVDTKDAHNAVVREALEAAAAAAATPSIVPSPS